MRSIRLLGGRNGWLYLDEYVGAEAGSNGPRRSSTTPTLLLDPAAR